MLLIWTNPEFCSQGMSSGSCLKTLWEKEKNIYTTQNLLRITFSFNDLMLKTNRLKKDFFI